MTIVERGAYKYYGHNFLLLLSSVFKFSWQNSMNIEVFYFNINNKTKTSDKEYHDLVNVPFIKLTLILLGPKVI